MNAPLYPNRGRMSGLSEDGKADRVVDKNGMVNPKWVQRVFIEVEVPRNHVECDGDDMAVHNVGGPGRRANAPLAQLVESIRLISERSPVQARQGARFTPRGAYSIRKSVTILQRRSPSVRIWGLFTSRNLNQQHMIKRNQAWFWKIFRAIKSIIIFSLRMIAATILGLISIVSIFEWYEKPLNIHLLILAIISIFIVVRQIVIMTYESEKWFRGVICDASPFKT